MTIGAIREGSRPRVMYLFTLPHEPGDLPCSENSTFGEKSAKNSTALGRPVFCHHALLNCKESFYIAKILIQSSVKTR